jgi:F-type H+-transporting ATPase subunit gamma
MSKLIQMRQRIKAIETIKKITHAMRLISMSLHSRLKHKQSALSEYRDTISLLLAKVQQTVPDWQHPIMHPNLATKENPLIIVIGSQKGLCGSFNTMLFQLLSHEMQQYKTTPAFIAVGKKAVDFTQDHYSEQLIFRFEEFTARNFLSIAQQLIEIIMQASPCYSSVVVFGNTFKGFFTQKPIFSSLIPFNQKSIPTSKPPREGYIWDQSSTIVLNFIVQQYITAQFQHILFESLLSEHAARFISMDSSTRNANKLLETTKLEYNKLRQAKITKELTELIGSF